VGDLLLDHHDGNSIHVVNAKSQNGSTPVSLAISSAKLDVAYILLDHGAWLQNEECHNNSGKTPLDMAPTLEMKQALVNASTTRPTTTTR
jgi:ankyrin repeat protein